MSSLTIANDLPPQLIVLSAELIDKKDDLIEQAHHALVLPPLDNVDQWRSEDLIAKAIGGMFKAVEEDRLAFGRKLKAVGDRVQLAANEALVPLKDTWQKLVTRCKAFEDAENERRELAARKAREDQARRQREEDARAAAAAEEAKRRAEMEAEPGEPPAPVEFVPEVMPKHVERAYVPPQLKSSAASKKGNKTLAIIDERQIPFEINGVRLWKEPNASAIKALLTAGIAVPGCLLEEPAGYSMKGGRA